jgi:GNAT superfamily N-acetyltransferase
LVIDALSPSHDREHFDCGQTSLNDYIRFYAHQHAKKRIARTYVAVEAEIPHILGYYTICSSSVPFQSVPENIPRHPTPVVLLGRLAVDLRHQGRRIGEMLLIDALKRSVQVGDILGVYAVAVEALHEKARAFYLKYGFSELLDNRLHLYLPILTINKTVSGSGS